MGGLHGGFRSFSALLFLGRLTRGFRSFSVALFVFLNLPLERFIRGIRFFSASLFVFFKFAFGAVYTGESVFSPLSMRCCFVLSLYGALWAPIFLLCLGAGAPVWVCRQLAL